MRTERKPKIDDLEVVKLRVSGSGAANMKPTAAQVNGPDDRSSRLATESLRVRDRFVRGAACRRCHGRIRTADAFHGRPRSGAALRCGATRPNRSVPPLAQPIEASLAKPDLNASTSVSISASVIGVENTHVPVLMMLQPSL